MSLRKIPVSREDTFWIEQTSKDTSLLTLCEQYEECQVLTVNSQDEITDRLAIELALQGAYIRQIAWLPGSQVQLMVVTNKFVKIYDLSQDNISPMHYFTLLEDSIIDAVLVPILRGRLVLFVLSQHGMLYRQQIEVEGYIGAQVLAETIHLHSR